MIMDYETELKMNQRKEPNPMDKEILTTLTAAIAELTISVKELTVVMGPTKRKVRQKKSISTNNVLDKDNIYNNIHSKNRAKKDPDLSFDIRSVVAHYRTYHPKALRTLLKKSKTYLGVRGRLEDGYTVTELVAAIDGIHKSPFHLGQNESKTRYLSLELCMRNAEQVERFIAIARDEVVPDVGVNTMKTVTAAKEWLKNG